MTDTKITAAQRKAMRRRELSDFVASVKNVPCMDCNVRYPSFVMDFDHRDRSTKIGNIADMVHDGAWNKVIAEIAKCDIICANCHRIRTFGG